jgi:hypothetical protein
MPIDRRVSVGDIWFLKLPGATAVTRCEIMNLTEYTVLIRAIRTEEKWPEFILRYKISDVDFVEFSKSTSNQKVHQFRTKEKK